jgi:hypothetical protein
LYFMLSVPLFCKSSKNKVDALKNELVALHSPVFKNIDETRYKCQGDAC